MAVYTHVTTEQVSAFLTDYNLGDLQSVEGIAQGVSNTNYVLITDQGRYILTLFEPHRVDVARLDFFLAYAGHLAASGVPSARAIENASGALYGTLAERPAAIMSFCEGAHPAQITADLCGKAGALLAQVHLAGALFEQTAPNDYGLKKWQAWARQMDLQFDDIHFGLAAAVRGELADFAHGWPEGLPSGAIHGDFFPDNVFFDQANHVSGVIDFHFVCTDFFAYDLAIAINAWCFDEENTYISERYQAMLAGYHQVRPLSKGELVELPWLLRGAALRFLLSRCEELFNHKEGDMMQPHDPQGFIKRLEFFQNEGVL